MLGTQHDDSNKHEAYDDTQNEMDDRIDDQTDHSSDNNMHCIACITIDAGFVNSRITFQLMMSDRWAEQGLPDYRSQT